MTCLVSRREPPPPTVHLQQLDDLHGQLAYHVSAAVRHVDAIAVDRDAPSDTRYHLHRALRAVVCSRLILQEIDRHCGLLEAAVR